MRIIMKFGGSSMADAEKIRHCASIIQSAAEQNEVVATVSAMAGVTDQLIELAEAAASGNRTVKHTLLGALRAQHETAAGAIGADTEIHRILDDLETLATGIEAVGELTQRSRDAVLAYGEHLSTALIAKAANAQPLSGREAGIVTDDRFGEASPLMHITCHQIKERLEPLLAGGATVIVTGFQAATQHGVVTTLGRGGSDYTATILGKALHADEIRIFSDVDGLMTADPRMVNDAKLLDGITFAEAVEMGQFGAKSMHPRALEPAAEAKIPVRMANTFHPDAPGTLIAEGAPEGGSVRSVLMLKNVALLTVSGAAMIGRPGTAASIFSALASEDVNILMISQTVSEAGISMVISKAQLTRASAVLDRKLLRTGLVKGVQVDRDTVVVAVVGAKMHGEPGIAAKIFTAIAEGGVNVLAIAQGSSELSICILVHADDGPTAVQVLHTAFDL